MFVVGEFLARGALVGEVRLGRVLVGEGLVGGGLVGEGTRCAVGVSTVLGRTGDDTGETRPSLMATSAQLMKISGAAKGVALS